MDDSGTRIDRIIELELKSTEYRKELLQKYSKILLRQDEIIDKSEERITNVNRMVTDLISAISGMNNMQQTLTSTINALLETCQAKERRLIRLEDKFDDLDDRYVKLLSEYKELAKMQNTSLNISQNNKPTI